MGRNFSLEAFAAFLGPQLPVLADLTDKVDLDGAPTWRSHADTLFPCPPRTATRWRGTSGAPQPGGRAPIASLLNLLPLLAAEHLSPKVVTALVGHVSEHLTEWGRDC